MNALCFSVAALPPTAQVAPLGEPLLVAIREKRFGHKERAEVQEDA